MSASSLGQERDAASVEPIPAGATSLSRSASRRLPGAHLVARFASSLSSRPPSAADESWARRYLSDEESALWARMASADRRHSIVVARRFVAVRPAATRAEVAGALLHDVGKIEAGLGVAGRVAATVLGPRTARWRTYHDHEPVGARLASGVGSDPETVALIQGRGPAAAELRAADDV